MSSIKNLNLLILTIVLCAYGYALPYSNGNSGSDQTSSVKASGAYTHAEKRNIDNQRLAANEVNEKENKIVPTDDRARLVPTLSTGGTINSNTNSVTGLDREAIIFPDSLPKQTPKDSYGNPVTPYSILPDEPATRPTDSTAVNVGHKTDVNRDAGISGFDDKKQVTANNDKDNFAFILPSYASGIMKLETYSDGHVPVRISDIQKPQSDLLPPLSSGNFNYPEIYKDSTKKPTQTTSTTGIVNRVDNQQPLNINPPSDTLVPPPPQSGNNINFNQDRKTTTTLRPTSYQSVQSVPTLSQFVQPPLNPSQPQQNYQTTQNQFQPIPTQSSPFLQPPRPGSPPNFQSQPAQPNQQSQQIPTQPTFLQPPKQSVPQNFQPSQPADSGKYTGSFGGAPGFLTPYNKPIVPPPTQLTSTSAATIPSTQSTITTTTFTSSTVPQTTGISFINRFSGESSHVNILSTVPALAPISSHDKYTGTFGGPPGILSPFDVTPALG